MKQYLKATDYIESEHPKVIEFCQRFARGDTALEQAVSVYYGVRDEIRYDPFSASLEPEGFKASSVLELQRGWCVPKAVLLAACCRHLGIPARLGFADVTNHMSTEKMRAVMKTDVFYWHGYTSIYLNDRWVKATPAFNLELCQKFGLKPLEFNGVDDSLYHEFDQAGNRHMQYLNDRGDYDDLPYQEIIDDFKRYYPGIGGASEIDFDRDVEQELKQR